MGCREFPFLCFSFRHPCLFFSPTLFLVHTAERAARSPPPPPPLLLLLLLHRNQTGGLLKRFPPLMGRNKTPQVICTGCGVTLTEEHMTYRLFFVCFVFFILRERETKLSVLFCLSHKRPVLDMKCEKTTRLNISHTAQPSWTDSLAYSNSLVGACG